MSLLIDRILKSKRDKPFEQLKGADGLSIAQVFQHNQVTLERLERAIDPESRFTIADSIRFKEIMAETFYDSKNRFGSRAAWNELLLKDARRTPVDPEIEKRFPKNPEAARALLEEMARSWASDEAVTMGNFEMTEAAVKKQVEKMRADPDKVMRFIGARYKAGRYKDAAVALQHSRRLALNAARERLAKKPNENQ